MLRRLVAPALVALGLMLGTPMMAQAATLNLDDARGDVHRMSNTGREEFEKAVGERRTDILRTTIRHTQHALVIRTKLLELKREGTIALGMRVRTNDGTHRVGDVRANRRIGWRGQSSLTTRSGQGDCATQHTISYATDVITLRIPGSCLNDPRWVQTNVSTTFSSRRQFLIDNAHTTGVLWRAWSQRIRRG